MVNCAVYGCTNSNRKTKGTDIKYFRFPKNNISSRWVVACRRKDKINLKNATICSIHFEPQCFELPLKMRLLNYQPKTARLLKNDAIPTLHLPGRFSKENDSDRTRSGRMVKRQHAKVIRNNLLVEKSDNSQELNISNCLENEIDNNINESEIILRQEVTADKLANEELKKKVQELTKLNEQLIIKMQKVESERDNLKSSLESLLTPGQLQKLLSGKKTVLWLPEDITSAIS